MADNAPYDNRWHILRRCDLIVEGVQVGGHWMLTIGTERAGLRVTRGRLSRRGRWHPWQPCVFLLWRGRRVDVRVR
jgi:hypothetical protein